MSADANSQRPRHFPAAPDVRRYFPAACMESARERLVRAVARQEGPAIVCGPAGVGKTMLLDVLAEHFARQMEVARIIGGQIDSRRSLLQLVLFHVGLPYQGLEEAELRISLLTRLQRPTNPDASAIVPPRLLLLIDEADRLPSDVFEELRGLANLADGGASLVQLVLFGGAALEEQLAEPELGAFSQRLSARCYLSPMNREETHQYVRSHVAAVGDDPDELLTTGALDALYSATGGVPRLVSQLGDQLLWLADREPGAALTAAAVQQVWSDLQQLPTPWELQKSAACPEPSEAGGDVIEFGTLDESSAEEGSLLTLEGEFCRHVETIDIQFADLRDLDQASPVDEVEIECEFTNDLPIGEIAEAQACEEEFDDVEADDDMPASIPFEPVEKDVVERVDVSDSEEETSVSGAADRADPSDPFAGPFDSEELVIDRYVAFESELLQAAPHVVNRVDAAFAGDLNQASAFAAAAALADAEALAADGPDAESPALTDDVQQTDLPDETSDGVVSAFQTSTAETLSAEEPGEDRVQFEAGDEADRNGDEEGERVVIATSVDPARQELLVVEDDGRETPQVVSARQFRRLFSDLESAQVRQA